MRLLYDSKHFHIILICQWRGVICEMAEVTFVAETLRHACEFLGYFRTLSFHISCAVSAVLAVYEIAITAITAVYVFVFFLNKQIRITDSFSIDYADLHYCFITTYLTPTDFLHFVLSPFSTCPWR